MKTKKNYKKLAELYKKYEKFHTPETQVEIEVRTDGFVLIPVIGRSFHCISDVAAFCNFAGLHCYATVKDDKVVVEIF